MNMEDESHGNRIKEFNFVVPEDIYCPCWGVFGQGKRFLAAVHSIRFSTLTVIPTPTQARESNPENLATLSNLRHYCSDVRQACSNAESPEDQNSPNRGSIFGQAERIWCAQKNLTSTLHYSNKAMYKAQGISSNNYNTLKVSQYFQESYQFDFNLISHSGEFHYLLGMQVQTNVTDPMTGEQVRWLVKYMMLSKTFECSCNNLPSFNWPHTKAIY